MKISQQLSRHSVAVISLLVALTALGYNNTWQNEQTEFNRNARQTGFEMLLHIGKLQCIAASRFSTRTSRLSNLSID